MLIYILHVVSPLFQGSQTQHYSGQTESLRQRIETHATGQGARLTREFTENGMTFVLGALAQCSKAAARRVERQMKDSKNLPRYCTICNPGTADRIPETLPLSLDLVPFATDSASYTEKTLSVDLTMRAASTDDEKWIQSMMSKEKTELGFLASQSIKDYTAAGRCVIADGMGERHGYAMYSVTPDRSNVKIQQVFVKDDSRMQLIGEAIINYIEATHPRAALTCHVRHDLPAVAFWTAIGFEQLRRKEHKSSKQTLIQYHRPSFTNRIIIARKDS